MKLIRFLIIPFAIPVTLLIAYIMFTQIAQEARESTVILSDAPTQNTVILSKSRFSEKEFIFDLNKDNEGKQDKIRLQTEWNKPRTPWPEGVKFPLVVHLNDLTHRINKKKLYKDKKNRYISKNYVNDIAYSAEYITNSALSFKIPAFNLVPILQTDSIWSYHSTTTKPQMIQYVNKAILQLLNEYPIDRKRIYIVGCGVGGTGVFGAINLLPNLYAAGVSHSGEWNNMTKRLSSTPLLMITGSEDVVIPTRITRAVAQKIKREGGNVTYKEINSMPHNCSYKGLYSDNVWKWMFSQKRK